MEIKSAQFNISSEKPRVLVAPLDWGLGHATRCIPLISELLLTGCEVLVAGEGSTRSLLQSEFPALNFIPLRGYRIKYTHKKNSLSLKIVLQLPSIILTVFREHQWLKNTVKKYKISAVISDNRFGLYHSAVPSVYLTHQLMIKTGNPFSEKTAQKMHDWFIKKFRQCWVPDFEAGITVAGELSHPPVVSPNVQYLGCFSRFEKKQGIEKIYDLLVIISGPEPQRTILEELLLQQLSNYEHTTLFIRGLPGNTSVKESSNKAIQIKNHVPAKELNEAIQRAKLVISRSGYTTLMDLIRLQQRAILIPTPGQAEQEYLARHLMKQKMFYCVEQADFFLEKAIKEASGFSFDIPSLDMEQYKKTLRQFVGSL